MAVRKTELSFESDARIDRDWQQLRFHERPDLAEAISEHAKLRDIFKAEGIELLELAADDALTLDSIYVRDATIVSPKGLIFCYMGRPTRRTEAGLNIAEYEKDRLPGTFRFPRRNIPIQS